MHYTIHDNTNRWVNSFTKHTSSQNTLQVSKALRFVTIIYLGEVERFQSVHRNVTLRHIDDQTDTHVHHAYLQTNNGIGKICHFSKSLYVRVRDGKVM